jgi:hypothetical protein
MVVPVHPLPGWMVGRNESPFLKEMKEGAKDRQTLLLSVEVKKPRPRGQLAHICGGREGGEGEIRMFKQVQGESDIESRIF